MSHAGSRDVLLQLARSRSATDRERLLHALIDLVDASGGGDEPQVRAQLTDVFMTLVANAEREIRRRLAEKLAPLDWAPPALINVLALDDIEIARPVIALSPVLQDHDLVRVLVEATLEHQIEVARRPNIGAPVVAAILKMGEPAVLSALAGNETAEVTEGDVRRLVEAARRAAALRSPLSRHPKLTAELAMELYAWVGETLRDELADRFRIDPARLEDFLSRSVLEAHTGAVAEAELQAAAARTAEREAMEGRLLDKLDAAGELRPSYLIRALREGRLSAFVGALCLLGGFEPDQVRSAIDSDQPELLALACSAVGIDRGAFPTILQLVRQLNGGRPGGGAEGARRAAGAFGPFSAQIAGAAFRQAAKVA